MAFLTIRRVPHLLSRAFSVTTQRMSKDDPDRFFKPEELMTGMEKFLHQAEKAGYDDVFYMKPRKRGPGTKDNPNLVPSYVDQRLIGCVCEEDADYIRWLWIHLDDPRRCHCGHWFKLDKKVLPVFDDPI